MKKETYEGLQKLWIEIGKEKGRIELIDEAIA